MVSFLSNFQSVAAEQLQVLWKQADSLVIQPLSQNDSWLPYAVTFGVLGPLSYIVYKNIIYNLYLHPLNRLPGPPLGWDSLFLLGKFREVTASETAAPQMQWSEEYGGIIRYHGLFNEPRVLVSDPELLKQILVTHQYEFKKPKQLAEFIGKILGIGLLVAEGDEHRRQRKLLNPVFSINAIRSMVPDMFVPAKRLTDVWTEQLESGEKEIDILAGLSKATLDVISINGFGYDYASSVPGAPPNRLNEAYNLIFAGTDTFLRIMFAIFPFMRKFPLKRNIDFRGAIHTIDDESKKLVVEARKRANGEKQGSSRKTTRDLLTIMANERDGASGEGMSDSLLQAQVMTFLAAGHETTSVTVTWALHELSQHQDLQDQLREEVKSVFSSITYDHSLFADPLSVDESELSDANIPSYDEINNLPFLNNVVKEILRLIPPVPMTNRTVERDIVIGGHLIPKGSTVFIPPAVTQRMKSIWGEDALEFRPSRWDEPLAQAAGPYTYMPFLAGGRQCIGNRFALIEIKILLGVLINSFKFFEKPGVEIKKRQAITWRPKPDLILKVERV
ncbi:Cytochrome P450 4V2 [Umbelopsis nana]